MWNSIRRRLATRARRIHEDALIAAYPEITIIRTDTKITKGRDTGCPCVTIGVENKISAIKMKTLSIAPIPSKLGRVKTDVVEAHRIHAPPTGRIRRMGAEEHQQKFRPVPGGVSAIERCSSACTVTCSVWSKKLQEPVMLQNFHCANLRGCGDKGITQPSPYDKGIPGQDDVAKFIAGDVTNPKTDSAINQFNDVKNAAKEILKLGVYRGYAVPEVGDTLIKSGRTSGVTTGTVKALDATAPIDYGDYGLIVKRDLINTTKMLDGGDSSSPAKRYAADGTLLNELVGQGFAGSDEDSLFVKIPNIINDPALKEYELDFTYDWEGNGGGEDPEPPEPPAQNCEDNMITCANKAKGDLLKGLICVITYWLCKAGIMSSSKVEVLTKNGRLVVNLKKARK